MSGATVINDGRIALLADESSAFNLSSGAKGINNGVVTAGYLSTDTNATFVSGGKGYVAGISAVGGPGTQFTNNGIYNIAAVNQDPRALAFYNFDVNSFGGMTNNGAMNIGVNNSDKFSPVYGAKVSSNGTFTNSSTGVMYLGRGASGQLPTGSLASSLAAGGADTTVSAGGFGVYVADSGRVSNIGEIIIGSGMQNSAGILVKGGTTANVLNQGLIDVRGAVSGAPLQNAGILVNGNSGTSVINNAGTINLSGVNGVGVKTLGGGKATSSGQINVFGFNGASLPNYGLWSEGAGSVATLSGAINMAGDGAIAAHARDSGVINIAGAGAVNFSAGKNQIGYFVYGAGAAINSNSTTTQDVSTEGSTLYRMQAGADYTGGAGVGSSLTASGINSTGVMVTGTTGADVSAFNSGGMTVNLAGKGSTGVRVEGGAQGKISSTAVINLSSVGAIAGIADGQAHDLAGVATGDEVAGVLGDSTKSAGAVGFGQGTILVSGASLNSMLDGITGYIARNSAEVSNTGNIVFGGNDATGVFIEAGARGDNSGSIEVGAGGTGIVAQDATGTKTTVVNNTGALILNGGSLTHQTVGVSASGSHTTVNLNGGDLLLNGNGAIGVDADAGALVQGKIVATSAGQDSTAIHASGGGSRVHGLVGSTLSLTGVRATGVKVENGAIATLDAGAVINPVAAGSIAGVVDGAGSVFSTGADVSSSDAGVIGFEVTNLGKLVNSGMVRLSGALSKGVELVSGVLENSGNVTANGTAIYVEGANSVVANNGGTILATDGVAAVEVGQGASLSLVGSGLGTIEGRGSADAARVDAGAVALSVNGAHLVVNAAGATGNGIENKGEISGIQLLNTTIDVAGGIGLRTATALNSTNSGTINISGSGTGINFTQADGSVANADLDLSGSQALTINATGAGAKGIIAHNAGTVKTAATVNVTSATGGPALTLGASVTAATNSGVLSSASATAATVTVASSAVLTNTSTGSISGTAAGKAVVFDDQDSTLINQGQITGTVDLGAGSNQLLNTGTITGDVVVGGANNQLAVASGTVTGNIGLTGATGTNTVLLQNGATINTLAGSVGNDTVTIKGQGNTFNTLDGGTSGNDMLVFDGALNILDGTHTATNFDQVNLSNSSVLTLQTVLGGKPVDAGGAGIDIDGSSTLALQVNPAAAYTFANHLTGSGLLTVDTGGNAFNFAATTGSNFAGTVALGSSTFGLAGLNTAALSHATLRTDVGSVTTVGDGNQQIGGLSLDGGHINFNALVPDQAVATSTITANTLSASGIGTIGIKVSPVFVSSAPDTPNTVNLLQQDDANIGVKLVSASTVSGSGGALVLQDQLGNAITAARQLDIAQGGTTVAKGTYDFRLTTAGHDGVTQDGLYVNYGLTQLDLQQGQTLTLAEDTTASGAASDMSAQLVGSGHLAVDAGAGVVSLSNTLNSYSGDTTVSSGTLRTDVNHALGNTQDLHIANSALLDLNGTTQVVQQFDGLTGSMLKINGGTLNIEAGGRSQGSLTGAGQLNLNGGVFDVVGANNALMANINIASAATAHLNAPAGLGAGDIDDDGLLIMDGVTGALANKVSGAGALNLTNGANVTVGGDNSAFSGTFVVDSGSTLVASAEKNLGLAAIIDNGIAELDAYIGTLVNRVSGTGELNLVNDARVTATADNSQFAGTFGIASGSALTAGSQNNLGSAAIVDNGELMLDGYAGALANSVSGAGSVNLIHGANVTATADNSGFSGTFNIAQGTTLNASMNSQLGSAAIVDNGELALKTSGAFALGNKLDGNGLVTVDTGGNAFDFLSLAGNSFAGTVAMGYATFNLADVNTAALSHAVLRPDANSLTTLGDGDQKIGGLTFNGGTVRFNAEVPDQTVATSTITSNTLDASGTGIVQIELPVGYVPKPVTLTNSGLLTQDEGYVGVKLVNATTVNGSAGALALHDQNDNVITAAQQLDIVQGGSNVAKATYDYRLTTTGHDGVTQDGLYVNYGLIQLDLHQGQTLTLAEDAGATGGAADMSARIIGGGNLNIDAGSGFVSLSNITNSYSGDTSVSSGTLRTDVNHALGNTQTVHLATGTTLALNGTTQTIQQFDGKTGSSLNVDGGTLNIARGGTSLGALQGEGQLNLTGGVLEVTGANAALKADTSIAAGATVLLHDAGGLGMSNITDNGALVLDVAQDGVFANALTGTGDLLKKGAGSLTLERSLSHTGETEVQAGVLLVGSAANPAVTLGGQGAGTVTVGAAGTLTGLGTVSGLVHNQGTVSALNATAGHESDPAGTLTLASGLVNDGTVNLAGTRVGNQLVVKGGYVGHNGQVVLNTVMGADNSATDKLVLDGGYATGNTELVIKSAGGNGAQTAQGIRVVETRNGASTSETAFRLSAASTGYRSGVGTLAVGAYDYTLQRGGVGGIVDDWYLSVVDTTCVTNGALCPIGPTQVPVVTPLLRPEAGSYLNNRQYAQNMQIHTLHERQTQHAGVADAGSPPNSTDTSWVRVVSKNSRRDGAFNSSDSSYLLHAGADIAGFAVGEGSVRFGVMGSYGSDDNHADNGRFSSRGKVDGYSLGVYGTWYGNQDIQTGPYVDTWAMYGKFDNTVKGDGLPTEHYKSNNVTSSVETGYSLPIYENAGTRVFIEPQAQAIVSNYRANAHTEQNGTEVSGQSDSSVTTRLGVRLHGENKDIRPFAEVNWWHGPDSQSIAFGGVKVHDSLPANRLEGKVGLQGQVTQSVSLWGSVGFEGGAKDYSADKVEAGVKIAF
ncbi:outer membrane autotransporter protein [Pseudomonas sp. 3296]|uniref:autotransporter outer membrane beta-barrel domain-containing protein n=1 Tax=Pseudomonas sp. 3296 TaxID=2817753 RepID=UPI00285DEA42|nr:autotransporter outer membrane beta-barrel domain-containing protein [Pseudomonas sp. 3296]MDR6918976.1 outer membrane autotransporter protein [Pseudomonas sp. 3296]